MSINNTAEAILAAQSLSDIKAALDDSTDYWSTLTHLQNMARFWLMRDEILQDIGMRRFPAADYLVKLDGSPAPPDLFARIKSLDTTEAV